MPDSGASKYRKNIKLKQTLGKQLLREDYSVPFSLEDFDKVTDMRHRLTTVEIRLPD